MRSILGLLAILVAVGSAHANRRVVRAFGRGVEIEGNSLYFGGRHIPGTFHEHDGHLFDHRGVHIARIEGVGGLIPGWALKAGNDYHYYPEKGLMIRLVPSWTSRHVGVRGDELFHHGESRGHGYSIIKDKLIHAASGREVIRVGPGGITLKRKWWE